MKSLEDFRSHFTYRTGFWRTIIKDTLIPHEELFDKEALLTDLHASLVNKTYYPAKPRGYQVHNKGNAVVRLVPVFQPQDMCVFYYCVKELEPFITGSRVPNTYGGWTLGGNLRTQEAAEIRSINEQLRVYEDPDGGLLLMDESGEYAIESSFYIDDGPTP